MGKIAVFDSGLGSLSIIRPIWRLTKSEIVYFADQKNFPYGHKTRIQLDGIIRGRIAMLRERFRPDLIIVGSNTPTLLLKNLIGGDVAGVTPPLRLAAGASKTGRIAILATKSVAQSPELSEFIKSQNVPGPVFRINASPLVKLVESGLFLSDPAGCAAVIRRLLKRTIADNGIDTATLSSTHLPFLSRHLRDEFPTVRFLDPAECIARTIVQRTAKSRRNRLRIYTSSDPERFHRLLLGVGIRNRVSFLP